MRRSSCRGSSGEASPTRRRRRSAEWASFSALAVSARCPGRETLATRGASGRGTHHSLVPHFCRRLPLPRRGERQEVHREVRDSCQKQQHVHGCRVERRNRRPSSPEKRDCAAMRAEVSWGVVETCVAGCALISRTTSE